MFPLIFKSPANFKDLLIYHLFAPLHHNDKGVPVCIHVLYVGRTEIASVQNKTSILVAISFCFLKHTLQLGYIIDASRIRFIEQRHPIVLVVSDGIVENRLVRGVIGDVDFFPVIHACIPDILKRYAVIPAYIPEKP